MIRRVLILVIIIGAVYAGYRFFAVEKPQPTSGSDKLSVTVVSPKQSEIAQELSVTGMTIPREEIVVITELSGIRIKTIYADVGDVVKKGQKLAELDGESLANQLAQLQSDYERTRDEFKRVDAIKNSGAVSRESVVQKRTAMQSAKAKLEDAQLNIKRSTIIAPQAGLVTERRAAMGALINASEPLYRIAQNGDIELDAMVPESDFRKLKVGQKAEVLLTGESESITAKIRLITPRVNSDNRMANIRIALQKNRAKAVGLFASVRIMLDQTSGIMLPATAILQDSVGSFVWKLDAGNKAMRLPVGIQQRSGDFVLVESLPTDIRVIARAGAFVKEGEVVNVVEKK